MQIINSIVHKTTKEHYKAVFIQELRGEESTVSILRVKGKEESIVSIVTVVTRILTYIL